MSDRFPYQSLKGWLVDATALPKDTLHVYVGLIVLLLAAAVTRRRVGDLLPLAVVALAALGGEAMDIADRLRWPTPMPPDAAGHVHDLWNTMFWPTALTLAGRFTPLLGPRASGDGGEQPFE